MISILLFVLFLTNVTSQLWVLSAFYLNRDYIAAHLCANRTDTQSACNGACVLERELTENEEHQQESTDLKGGELILYIDAPVGLTFNLGADARKSYRSSVNDAFFSQYIQLIFKPPIVIV